MHVYCKLVSHPEGCSLNRFDAHCLQDGPFGSALLHGMHYKARLHRSQVPRNPVDCQLLPCPRGSLADLKFVPFDKAAPGPGEIHVRASPSMLASHFVLLIDHVLF